MKFQWEEICAVGDCATLRAKVFGGWIVRTVAWTKILGINESHFLSESSVFINDPSHKWRIEDDDNLNFISVEELDFYYVRTNNCLRSEGIQTIGQLLEWSEIKLLRTPNLGRKSLEDIKQALQKRNLSLKND